jgi:hypothetical protein
MFAVRALQQFVREETLPGAQIQSDDELRRLRAAQWRHLLSRQLHLHEGHSPDERRRKP